MTTRKVSHAAAAARLALAAPAAAGHVARIAAELAELGHGGKARRGRIGEPPEITPAPARAEAVPAWRRALIPAISILALAVGLLDFLLIVGAVPVPIPGLRVGGVAASPDRATYGFEHDTDGWKARGAATTPFVTDTHAFAGATALAIQMAAVSDTKQAFVYTSLPAQAAAGSRVVARLTVPGDAPPLIAAVYVLDDSWKWSNGEFVVLRPGQWTAVSYQIPAQAHGPIRELGVMIVGPKGYAPYAGQVYLDSVDVGNG